MRNARLTALVAGLLLPAAQAAQDTALPEVVVTGERTPRQQSETASSVAVVTGDVIDSMAGADRPEQVLPFVPNVQLGSGGEGPTIRGQDSTGVLRDLPGVLGGTRPRATLQVDGRPAGFSEFIFGATPLWDVEGIEVFRSPQTTTQGRNSIGGAIFIETREPVYEWEGRMRWLGGDARTRQGSVVVSGPLIADQLAFRVAGDFRRSRTASRIADDEYADADPNRDDYALLRVKLLAEPHALPDTRFLATWVHVESDMPQIEGVVPPFEAREDPDAGYGVFSTRVDSLVLAVEKQFSPVLRWTTTLTGGDADIERHAPPGFGQTQTASTDYSAESILHFHPAGPLRALGGLHVLGTRLDQRIDLSLLGWQGAFHDRQDSLGLFGELEMRPSPQVAVTAGLRYQRDGQDRRGGLASPDLAMPIDFDGSFHAWLPKLSVAYEVVSGSTVGLLVQRAFNPGGTGFNFDTFDQFVFGAETLWNYEAFTRLSFADGRAVLNANLFHSESRGAQRARSRAYTVPGGGTAFWAQIHNVPRAGSRGLEAELAWSVSRRLQLRAGLGLLDTQITETTDADDPLRGREFQRAPHVTATAAIDWRPVDRWRVSVQGRHNSAYFSDDANTPELRVTAATVVEARASYERRHWSMFGYARNVFDRFYMTSYFDDTLGTAGDPREIGVGFEVRFGQAPR